MKNLIKTEEQIQLIKEAARIVSLVHYELKKIIKKGVSLLELDKKAEQIILSEGGTPSFKGYEGYPNSICASVNSAMVHGIPNNYILQDGDIISVDVGVTKNGWNGDAAFSMSVGKSSERGEKLLNTTKEALMEAITFAKPGVTLGQLGAFIESFAIRDGFTSARDYVGHGIGQSMHEDPFIPNYGYNGGIALKEGMTICIEPMFIDGADDLFVDPIDKWTVRTKHGGLTAHEEHTIVIRKNGGEILSKI